MQAVMHAEVIISGNNALGCNQFSSHSSYKATGTSEKALQNLSRICLPQNRMPNLVLGTRLPRQRGRKLGISADCGREKARHLSGKGLNKKRVQAYEEFCSLGASASQRFLGSNIWNPLLEGLNDNLSPKESKEGKKQNQTSPFCYIQEASHIFYSPQVIFSWTQAQGTSRSYTHMAPTLP